MQNSPICIVSMVYERTWILRRCYIFYTWEHYWWQKIQLQSLKSKVHFHVIHVSCAQFSRGHTRILLLHFMSIERPILLKTWLSVFSWRVVFLINIKKLPTQHFRDKQLTLCIRHVNCNNVQRQYYRYYINVLVKKIEINLKIWLIQFLY